MGLTVKNKNNYDLSEEISNFFTLPLDDNQKEENYEELKENIYSLDIDNEEKANILNLISSLEKNLSLKEKNNIIKEIESFKEKYDL